MRGFYSYLLKTNPEDYFKERASDLEFNVRKVRRKMKRRKKEYMKKMYLERVSIVAISIMVMGFIVSSTFTSFASSNNDETIIGEDYIQEIIEIDVFDEINAYNGLEFCQVTDAEELSYKMQISQNVREQQVTTNFIAQKHEEVKFETTQKDEEVKVLVAQVQELEERVLSTSAILAPVPPTPVQSIPVEIAKGDMALPNYSNERIQYVLANDIGIGRSDISLPIDYQEYMYLTCKEYDLDYKRALSVSLHESAFDVYATGKNYRDGIVDSYDRGLFQLNSKYSGKYAEMYGVPHAPYNPYINIEIGVRILSDLYSTYQREGYTGVALEEAVLSSYNRGEGGFRKYGVKSDYVKKVNSAYATLFN